MSSDQFEQLMKGVGKRTEVPEAVRQKAERHFRLELGRANASRQRRKTIFQYTIAATIVLSISLFFYLDEPESGPDIVVAVIDEYLGEGYWATNGVKRPLGRGYPLNVGTTLTTKDGFVRLAMLNNDVQMRIGKHSRLLITGPFMIKLERGSVYVDAGIVKDSQLTISTDFGDVEHIGTQYLIIVGKNELSIAVREGQVKFSGEAGELLAKPSGLLAELLKINRAGGESREYIAKYGDHWSWVNKLSPEFPQAQGEEKSLLTFLTWYARETGHEIQYANTQTKLQVELEPLGNIGSLSAIVKQEAAIEEFVGNFGLKVVRLDGGIILLDRKF